ncbi:MAG TPA: carboxypeptidase-like regulatory domain-containing protein [Vicinamibacterales bacterium]|nr:carboxypeptidase-like regulatory domain-containing protein [Vicinamibacterales bacterium]
MRFTWILLASALLVAACHPGPVVNAGAKQPPTGGTIAGVVTTADSAVAVPGRKVTVIETTSGSRYETTTADNGGYTIRVPQGTYRIEVELRPGEALARKPDATKIGSSDLDSGRDFVITAAKPAR